MPLTHGTLTLALVAMLLGAGNGLSSGVVMTLGADFAPPATRVPFLGVWRVLSDLGTAGGPLAVAAATAAITLGGAAVTVGGLGLVAAAYVSRYVPETGVRRAGRRPALRPSASTSPAPITRQRSPSRSRAARTGRASSKPAASRPRRPARGVGRRLGDRQPADAGEVLGALARRVDVEHDDDVGARRARAPNSRRAAACASTGAAGRRRPAGGARSVRAAASVAATSVGWCA